MEVRRLGRVEEREVFVRSTVRRTVEGRNERIGDVRSIIRRIRIEGKFEGGVDDRFCAIEGFANGLCAIFRWSATCLELADADILVF